MRKTAVCCDSCMEEIGDDLGVPLGFMVIGYIDSTIGDPCRNHQDEGPTEKWAKCARKLDLCIACYDGLKKIGRGEVVRQPPSTGGVIRDARRSV